MFDGSLRLTPRMKIMSPNRSDSTANECAMEKSFRQVQ